MTRRWFGVAVLVLAAGVLPGAAGAQSAPEVAEPEPAVSAVSSAVLALGGSVVLDGTVSFGSGVSGASGGSGFAGYSRRGGIGSLEVSSVDGAVFGDGSEVYALAQIAGAVDVGPAVGTVDAVVLTVSASVDLSDGFWLAVGDHLLSSDGATVPVGELNSTGGLRYWLWNAPCKDWEPGDTVPVSIVTFGDDPAERWADASLGGLALTGATLDTELDPATLQYSAIAPAGSQQVTIEASAPFACSIDISPADADPGAEGHQVGLGDDGAQVTVTVTAPDGDTTGQHTVQISHRTAEDEGEGRSQAEVQSLVVDGAPDPETSPSQPRGARAERQGRQAPPCDDTSVDSADRAGSVSFDVDADVDVELTAALHDPDASGSSVQWSWFRSAASDRGFTQICGETAASYTPAEADRGMFLMAKASYRDTADTSREDAAVTERPVGVNPVVLLSNTGQPGDNPYSGNDIWQYQPFMTGDNPAGYVLTGAGVEIGTPWWPGVHLRPRIRELRLYTQPEYGRVGASLLRFEPPQQVLYGTTNRFAVPGTEPVVLKPNTTYYIGVKDPGQVVYVRNDAVDAGTAHGWTLPRPHQSSRHVPFVAVLDNAYISMELSGYALEGPPGPPTQVTATPGNASVTLSWSEPGSLGHRPVIKYQVRHYEMGAAEADYGPWADVADANSDSDLADERSAVVTGLTAGTAYTFEIRAVNDRGSGVEGRVGSAAHSAPSFSAREYPGATASLTVKESPTGPMSHRVTAGDVDGDVLYYTVGATSDANGQTDLEAFNSDFAVGLTTGEITLKPGAVIDYDERSRYRVVLQASDREDATGASQSVPYTVDASIVLTIEVYRHGAVTLDGPAQAGVPITAALSDDDGSVASATWRWQVSDRRTTGFENLWGPGAGTATYTPRPSDAGKYLRAAVTYTDAEGPGQRAHATTAQRVFSRPALSNLGQSSGQDVSLSGAVARLAQQFTTGPSVGGYWLGQVRLGLSAPAGTTLKWGLYANDDSGAAEIPGTQLLAGDFAEGVDQNTTTIEHSADLPVLQLEPDTSYWVQVWRDGGTGDVSAATASAANGVDPGGAHGWSWGGVGRVYDSGDPASWDEVPDSRAFKLSVAVEAVLGHPAGTASVGDPSPRVDTELTATASVPAAFADTVRWVWWRSPHPRERFAVIDGATSPTYTPVDGDLGYFLRVTAFYTDDHGLTQVLIGTSPRPVSITAAVLLSNTGQPGTSPYSGNRIWHYQPFTTGDNPAGYVLTGTGVENGSSDWPEFPLRPRVRELRLHAADPGSGHVGASLLVYEPPPQMLHDATNRFAVPGMEPVVLAPSTTYYISVKDPGLVVYVRNAALDAGAAHGWALPARLRVGDSARTHPATSNAYISMELSGYALVGPPGPPTQVAATPGDASVTLSWSEPGSLGHRQVIKYQVRHYETGAAEADRGQWIDVADANSDSDLADERSAAVAGLTAGTAYTFEIRGVNEIGNGTAARLDSTPN